MYEQVFNFNSRPFTATPFVKHYFAADSIQQALEQSKICVDRGSGPAIVIGSAGTGKTLLLAILEEQYRSQFNVVNLGCARSGERSELLQSVLFELQLPYKNMSETELRFSLIDYLKPSDRCPNGILLLVDEAHTLSTELLDEVRLITNFVRDGEPRVRLVMAGNQQLEETLSDPKLDSFNQRIAARCYLQNMSREETARYVVEHIDRAGGVGNSLFNEASLKAVHEVSDGCPRLVNQVCDQVLILTATQGRSNVNETCIHEAWADVQSIPGSLGVSADRSSETLGLTGDETWTVIEFGQLEETEDKAQSSEALSDNQLAADAEDFSELIESFAEEGQLALDEANFVSVGSSSCDTSVTDALEDEVVGEPACSVEAIETEVTDDLSAVDQQHFGSIDELEEQPSEMKDGDGCSVANENQFVYGIKDDQASIFEADVEGLADDDAIAPENSEEAQVAFNELASNLENCKIIDELGTTLNEDTFTETVPQATADGQSVEIVDPFSESFEDEECVVDQYSPIVAHQNQSSLSVTSDDLALIQPIDEFHEESRPAVYQAVVDNSPESDGDQAAELTLDSLQETFDVEEEVADVSADEAFAEPPPEDEPFDQLRDVEPMLDDVASGPMDTGDDEEAGYHNTSTDVEQKAEEILKRLGVSCETEGTDESANVETEIDRPSIPVLVDSVADSADQDSEVEKQNAALEETQQILNEILEQKNLLAIHQDHIRTENENSALTNNEDSLVDSSSQLDVESANDDREMIIVNRVDEPAKSAATPDESIPFPTTPVSTGRAERMDYQKLFEQLRDASNPET